jgi:predicted RNase H-like HicB family nuclease
VALVVSEPIAVGDSVEEARQSVEAALARVTRAAAAAVGARG